MKSLPVLPIPLRTILTLSLITLAVVLLACPDEVLAQCSMCKLALEASGNERLISGFKWSIAFMVTPPLLMTAGVGFLVLRSARPRAGTNESVLPKSDGTPRDQA